MDFRIEKAAPGEYADFFALIRQVYCGMKQKEWYVADDEEYLKRALLEENGQGYKAVEVESGKLAGILVAVFPGETEENLGFDAGLGEEERKQTAHIDSVAVRPEYLGRGLQRLLMNAAEKDLEQRGYRYLLCTVHPDNEYSRGNMARLNYKRVATKEKYGGVQRDIMLKRLG